METLQQVDRTWCVWRGQTLAYFGGCDYFRMASHPRVVGAAEAAIRKYGLNVAASRRTTGNHELYERLEVELAEFFGSESALLVSNGYLTNLAVAQGLRDRITHVLVDERPHSSLVDAARAAELPIVKISQTRPAGMGLIMVEGISSFDGSAARLRELIAMPDTLLLVDDSHGAGVVCEQGQGTPEFCGIARERVIQTVTLSKAFGCYGGAILASKEICEAIVLKSGALSGATPFPLPYAAAAIEAAQLLKDSTLRKSLRENLTRVTSQIGVRAQPGPILPIVPTDKERLTKALLSRGIFPSHIQYQNGPPQGYFRFAISSEHTRAQLDALAAAIIAAG